MKLYTYGPAGLESKSYSASNDSRYVRVEHEIAYELVRRADLDEPRSKGGSGYFTTPASAISAFIEQGVKATGLEGIKTLSREDRREWRAALKTAKEKLAAVSS